MMMAVSPVQLALTLSAVDRMLSALGGLRNATKPLPMTIEALTAIDHNVAIAPWKSIARQLISHLSAAKTIAQSSRIGMSNSGEGSHARGPTAQQQDDLEGRFAPSSTKPALGSLPGVGCQGFAQFWNTAIPLQTRFPLQTLKDLAVAKQYTAATVGKLLKPQNTALSSLGSRPEWRPAPRNAFDRASALRHRIIDVLEMEAGRIKQAGDLTGSGNLINRIHRQSVLEHGGRGSPLLAGRSLWTGLLGLQFEALGPWNFLAAHCNHLIGQTQRGAEREAGLHLQMGPQRPVPYDISNWSGRAAHNLANMSPGDTIGNSSIRQGLLLPLTLSREISIAARPPTLHLVSAGPGVKTTRTAPAAPPVTPTITINYSPNINGASSGDWATAARRHADELLRIIEGKLARRARLSFS